MKASTLLLLATALNLSASQADYRVVPLPKHISVTANAEPFVLTAQTCIAVAHDSLATEAEFLRDYIAAATGVQLKIAAAPCPEAITLDASLSGINPEAYTIDVEAGGVTINGVTSAGTFYGIQTLRKSIPAGESQVEFPAARISDWPRFGWRGNLLDVARHPMEPDSVKAYIDMLALHNVNRLHWHLTDDQGWRIEIPKYPRLAQVASTRKGTMIGNDWDAFDSIPVSGCYTRAEVIDIVDYAARQHITVVPEIDLPGHMVAALTAYPELGCTGGPYEVWQQWGVSDDLLCAGNDSVLRFLDDVVTEIASIFPSAYVHIGGDECPKKRWEQCSRCQRRIAELGLEGDEHSSAEAKLQTYVMAHVVETLNSLGRKVIGWDEILEGGLPGNAAVMSWRGTQGAYQAVKLGHEAILTPTSNCYFDYPQSLDWSIEPTGVVWGAFLPIKRVYGFEPVPEGLTPEQEALILGVQCNLWREYIKTLSHTQYMMLPRLAAISEVQWMDSEQKDYDDFALRAASLAAHYRSLGYRYCPHLFNPDLRDAE